MNRKHTAGFTLIELMIVVVIVGILASVALPAYREHVIRGNRAAAQAMMMDLANREQQYLVTNRVYADDGEDADVDNNLAFTLPDDVVNNYTADIAVDNDALPTFTITFTPIGPQAGDGNLTINNEGTKARDGDTSKWDR